MLIVERFLLKADKGAEVKLKMFKSKTIELNLNNGFCRKQKIKSKRSVEKQPKCVTKGVLSRNVAKISKKVAETAEKSTLLERICKKPEQVEFMNKM